MCVCVCVYVCVFVWGRTRLYMCDLLCVCVRAACVCVPFMRFLVFGIFRLTGFVIGRLALIETLGRHGLGGCVHAH